jgi:hypothetical protein
MGSMSSMKTDEAVGYKARLCVKKLKIIFNSIAKTINLIIVS